MRSLSSVGPLVAILVLVLAGPATAQLVQTVEVGSGGTPAANGAALLAAYAAVPGTAGPNEPWVVKVDAGIFDLGNAQLVVRNFVDLEGSGRNATFIRSSAVGVGAGDGTINVPTGVDAEVRNLTVQNFSQGAGAGVVNVSEELKLTAVNIEVDTVLSGSGFLSFEGDPRLSAIFSRVSAGALARGFDIRTGGAVINEAFAFVASFGTDSTGIFIGSNEGIGSPLVQDLAAVVLGGQNNNIGIFVNGGTNTPRFTNTRVTASGGASTHAIFVAGDSAPTFDEVIAEAFNEQGGVATGLRAANTSFTVATDSQFSGLSNSGVGTKVLGSAVLEVRTSTIVGTASAVSNLSNTATALYGACQLDGGVGGTSGVLKCVQSYDGNYDPIGANCL